MDKHSSLFCPSTSDKEKQMLNNINKRHRVHKTFMPLDFQLSICDIDQDPNIWGINKMVRCKTKTKLKYQTICFLAIEFYLKVLTKSCKILVILYKRHLMKRSHKGILASKCPIFSLNPTHQTFGKKFKQKCVKTFLVLHNILQSIESLQTCTAFYSC